MQLITCKCPNCGAIVPYNNNTSVKCEFCDSVFFISDSSTDKASAGKTSDFVIEAGVLVSYIGESADVVIPDKIHTINPSAFHAKGIKSVVIPSGVVDMPGYFKYHYSGTFTFCNNLEKVVFNNPVKTITEGMFFNCKSLKKISIPETVTSIERYAFSESGIEEIVLPENLSSIGEFAFKDCKNLKRITFPSKITAIKPHTFKNCTSLEEIIIPKHIVHIDSYAFYGCKNLRKVVIEPRSDTQRNNSRLTCSLAKTIFDNCPNLTDVSLKTEHSFYAEPYYFFGTTPWYEKKKKEWENAGLCIYCGNPKKGLFTKTCTVCGAVSKLF